MNSKTPKKIPALVTGQDQELYSPLYIGPHGDFLIATTTTSQTHWKSPEHVCYIQKPMDQAVELLENYYQSGTFL